jgi:hypothetical protein
MPRGRPPKPTGIHEISGSWKKNPKRKRARAAEITITEGLGDPPVKWSALAESNARCAALIGAWKEIVAENPGTLTLGDRGFVELMCIQKYKINRANEGYGKATGGDVSILKSMYIELARRRITGGPAAKAPQRAGSEWGELVG